MRGNQTDIVNEAAARARAGAVNQEPPLNARLADHCWSLAVSTLALLLLAAFFIGGEAGIFSQPLLALFLILAIGVAPIFLVLKFAVVMSRRLGSDGGSNTA
ncbi:MAG: hypothetical protein AAF458_18870 [Pseudomonadota bacterium]